MSALSAGLLRELSEVVLPRAVRRTRLYTELVENTLRFLIENVGQVEGAYPPQGQLADNFAVRRFAGNGIELIGLLTFQRIAGMGAGGAGRSFRHGPATDPRDCAELEGRRTAARRAPITKPSTSCWMGWKAPPDGWHPRPTRRRWTWRACGGSGRTCGARPPRFPRRTCHPATRCGASWEDLKSTAAEQERPIFEVSTLMALSAVSRVPENLLWLSRCARGAAKRTGQLFAGVLLDHYGETAREIRTTGFVAYWVREYRPYLKAAARQFSPRRKTLTERMLRSLPSRDP